MVYVSISKFKFNITLFWTFSSVNRENEIADVFKKAISGNILKWFNFSQMIMNSLVAAYDYIEDISLIRDINKMLIVSK